MLSPLENAASFLIQILFSVYIIVLLLRLLLQWHRIDFYNPVSQLVVKLTDPIIQPLRSILPRIANVDTATVVVLFIVDAVKIGLLFYLLEKHVPSILGLMGVTIASLLDQLLNVFFYAILIRIILSWVAPSMQHAIASILYTITEPLLRPVRGFVPVVAGFDFSSLIVLIGLKVISIILVQPFLIFV